MFKKFGILAVSSTLIASAALADSHPAFEQARSIYSAGRVPAPLELNPGYQWNCATISVRGKVAMARSLYRFKALPNGKYANEGTARTQTLELSESIAQAVSIKDNATSETFHLVQEEGKPSRLAVETTLPSRSRKGGRKVVSYSVCETEQRVLPTQKAGIQNYYEFEDELVNGQHGRNDGEIISGRPCVIFPPLIEIRRDFLNESIKLLEDLE